MAVERLRHHLWWIVPSFSVAVGLTVLVGYPLAWLGYAAFNVLGVWSYCDRHGSQRATAQLAMKFLAIVMVPVGVAGFLGSGGGGGQRPNEEVTFGSTDGATRRDSVRTSIPPSGHAR